MLIRCASLSHQTVYSLHLLSVSVCNIFVARYLFWNSCSCAAINSLPVSPFRSPLDSHNNVSSLPISSISTYLMRWPCSTLPSHDFYTYCPDFAFTCSLLSFLNLSQMIGLIVLQTLLLFQLLISYLVYCFCAFNNIYKLIVYIICVRIFCIFLFPLLYMSLQFLTTHFFFPLH